MRSLAQARALAATLAGQATAGWTATVADGYYCQDQEVIENKPDSELAGRLYVHAVFSRTDGAVAAVVALNVTMVGKYDRGTYGGMTVEGHTFVNGGCFTRRGIDVESVSLCDKEGERYSNDYADVAAMLAGQWERCADYVNRTKTAESVPGTPFTRQPAWFAETSEQLKAGKSVTLMPHGFGTGYTLSATRGSRFAKPAPRALTQRLGVPQVYVETFDAD